MGRREKQKPNLVDNSELFCLSPLEKEMFVCPIEVYNTLRNRRRGTLIIDVRPNEVYNKWKLRGKYNEININPSLIGLPIFLLEQRLSGHVKEVFSERNKFLYIILMDDDTTRYSYVMSKVKLLYDMLKTCDNNREHPPRILNGGFAALIGLYPNLSSKVEMLKGGCTGPNNSPNLKSMDDSTLEGSFQQHSISKTDRQKYSVENVQEMNKDLVCSGEEVGKIEERQVHVDEKLLQTSSLQVPDNLNNVEREKPIELQNTLNNLNLNEPECINSPELLDVGKEIFGVHPIKIRGNTHKGLNGLINIRRTCYLNAVVQCLRHIPYLYHLFVTEKYKEYTTALKGKLITRFGNLVSNLWNGDGHKIRPQAFYDSFINLNSRFAEGQQEDANDFLIILLNNLNNDIVDKTVFAEQFCYKIQTVATCYYCQLQTIASNMENMIILTPPLSGIGIMEDMIKDALFPSIKEELNCKGCKNVLFNTHVLLHQPRIIIIVLKRYYFDNNMKLRRISTPCIFPLNGLPFGQAKYKLWAMCLYQGTTYAGHYTAMCLNMFDKRWYQFDDTIVSPMDINMDLVERDVCMLFYEIADENSFLGKRENGTPTD